MWPSLEVMSFTDYAITFKRESLWGYLPHWATKTTDSGFKPFPERIYINTRKFSILLKHFMAFQETQIFTLFIYRGISQESYLTTMIYILTCNMLLLSLWVLWCVWFCVYKISVAFLRAICLESFHVTLLFTMLLFCCCFWDIMHLFSNEISIICWMFRSDSVGSSCSPNSYTLHTNFTLPSPSSPVKQARSCCTVLSSQFTLQVWKCAVIGTPILVHAT